MKLYDFTKHESIYEKIKKSNRKIYIYGMGEIAAKIIEQCNKFTINISGFFVDDEYFTTDTFLNFPVYRKSELLSNENSFDTLLAVGKSEENIQEIKYYTFYDKGKVYNSVYGFYCNWDNKFLAEKFSLIKETFDWLEDDYSKCVFNAYFKNRYEGDNSDLIRLATYPQYFTDVIKLTDKTTFIDAGAFTGDTVEAFLKEVNNFAEIYAFEPDINNYSVLQKNTALSNIYIYIIVAYLLKTVKLFFIQMQKRQV